MITILKQEHNQAIPRPFMRVDTTADAIRAIRSYVDTISYDVLLWAETYINTDAPIAVVQVRGDLTVKFYAFLTKEV